MASSKQTSLPTIDRDAVVRLWLARQGLTAARGARSLSRRALVDHLERTGGLQLDSINVLDRAHHLTLWSRFGGYDRARLDRLVYGAGVAYEYWGHEASILPISHLPLGLRRMRGFPPAGWKNRSWWPVYNTPAGSKRRVLARLRAEGALESAHFERRNDEKTAEGYFGSGMPMPKEDKRSLKLLWHGGRVAVVKRRHFRCVYDLAERIYPADVVPASRAAFEDSWLMIGLRANGVASESHLVGYFTDTDLKAPDRKRVLARNLKKGHIVAVRVEGVRGTCYALPEHLDTLAKAPEPEGTTLLSPFDSLLWQRKRAEELLGFSYRVEIYVPPKKRRFGYYVLPILHHGRLVGRLDPKLHRDRGELEIKAIFLEHGFARDDRFDRGLAASLDSLRAFAGADRLRLPRGWRKLDG